LRDYVSELNLEVFYRLQQNLVRTPHPSRTPGHFTSYRFMRAVVKTWRNRELLSWKWQLTLTPLTWKIQRAY